MPRCRLMMMARAEWPFSRAMLGSDIGVVTRCRERARCRKCAQQPVSAAACSRSTGCWLGVMRAAAPCALRACRYAIDGCDPAGYTGCMWGVAGLHDQGGQEKPVREAAARAVCVRDVCVCSSTH